MQHGKRKKAKGKRQNEDTVGGILFFPNGTAAATWHAVRVWFRYGQGRVLGARGVPILGTVVPIAMKGDG